MFDRTGAHGFVYFQGHFAQVDVPGKFETIVRGVNNAGSMVGTYADNAGRIHGFLNSDGQFTTLDVPGGFYVIPSGINNQGAIAGSYTDTNSHGYGFVRINGTFTTVDAPGNTKGFGTIVRGINDLNQIIVESTAHFLATVTP